MEVAVVKSFIDKNTQKAYNVGSVYISDDQERIIELQNGGYLDPNVKIKIAKAEARKTKKIAEAPRAVE